MRLILVLALLLFSSGCDNYEPKIPPSTNPNYGPDGYYYEAKPYEVTNLKIKMVMYPSLDDLRAAFYESYPEDAAAGTVGAYTVRYNYMKGVCEIHIVDPAVYYQPHYIGHELMHCVNGNWHPSQGN